MFGNKRVVVVMPAYNAAKTIERSFAEVCAQGVADTVIVVDDAGVVCAWNNNRHFLRYAGYACRSMCADRLSATVRLEIHCFPRRI